MPRDDDDCRDARAAGSGGWAGRGWGERLFIVAALAVKLLLLYVIFG